MKSTFGERVLIGLFKAVNLLIPWHKLPSWIGVINLLAFRDELRAKNLYDVYPSPDYQGKPGDPEMIDTKYLDVRQSDGLFNDLEQPRMGCVGMRFGRNVPRHLTKPPNHDELLTPNPRLVSEKLLARDKFKPATIVNLLAAAWIQFQVHDWFMHENSTTETVTIPLSSGDKWSDKEMKIERTQPDKILDETDKQYPTYRNTNTHWWDGSQIYGSSEERTRELRVGAENGKLKVDKEAFDTFLPRDDNGIPITGFYSNWWLGLELLHTLFVLEHNAICDELHSHNAEWTSDELFDTARLVNCALMAKIHTTDWTPAILAHPTLDIAMHANWWGLLGEKLYKILGRVAQGEVLSGIPGSTADQDGVPFSLTEEFVSVYRLHPLIPDNIAFFSIATGAHATTLPMANIAFGNARKPFLESKLDWADVLYSFGLNYPGAITINNHPSFLRDLHTPDGRHLDMATVDLLRDRERGVPRYNAFRRLFHLSPAKSFLDITGPGRPELTAQLAEIYNHDLESVDLLVGCLCEPLPNGFGFSDTAFRVFVLMASRRLKSDRFIATEFGKTGGEVYPAEAVVWVQNNGMKEVLCRHFPELRAPLKEVKNAFAPWSKLGRSKEYKGVETNA